MRFVIIVAMACQPYFSISFIYGAIPVVLRRNGAPLEMLGLFGLVFFAFTINFLWAPLVDRLALTRLGRRRSWLLATQAASVALVMVLAQFDPGGAVGPMLAAALLLATAAATQRVVVLGYAADALAPAERAWGATAFGWGVALGNVVGGAVCLALIYRFGWSGTLFGLAVFMAVLAVPILAIAEPNAAEEKAAAAVRFPFAILARAEAWRLLATLAPATFGIAVAFAMVQPRLVDLGFELAGIGTVAAAANLTAATLVGPAVGALAGRVPLWRLVIAGSALIACLLAVLTAASGAMNGVAAALAAVIVVFSALAALGVASNALFLATASAAQSATDVAFLSAMMSVAALAGFAASGFIAAEFGYDATLATALTGTVVTALLAACQRNGPNTAKETT